MLRYVVMVRGVDDSFTAYGTTRNEARAESFAARFNARVERYEDEYPDERGGVAWAYVMPLNALDFVAIVKDSGLESLGPRN